MDEDQQSAPPAGMVREVRMGTEFDRDVDWETREFWVGRSIEDHVTDINRRYPKVMGYLARH